MPHIRVINGINILGNMKKIVWTIAFILTSIPLTTFAHEGHGVVNTGPAHYMLAPGHILPIVLVLAVGVYFIRRWAIKKA